MKISASEASRATGKSIATIGRYIAKGKLSADRNIQDNGWLIEISELQRVFPITKEYMNKLMGKTGNETDETANETNVKEDETAILAVKLEAREREIALLLSERDDLRRRLDTEAEERRKLTYVLTDQRPKQEQKEESAPEPYHRINLSIPPKKKWWQFL